MVVRARTYGMGPEEVDPLAHGMPHSTEAERAIVGSVLLDNSLAQSAIDFGITVYDFYVKAHSLAWGAIVALNGRGAEIDPLTLSEELRANGTLALAGGMTFVSELTYGLPHFTNVAAYGKVLKDMSALRELKKTALLIAAMVDDRGEDEELREAHDLLARGEQMLMQCVNDHTRSSRRARRRDYVKVEEDIGAIKQAVRDAHEGKVRHLQTGLKALDGKLEGGGLRPQGFYIVAAKPKAGKTSLVLGISRRAAEFYRDTKAERSVGVISMEMQRLALEMRMLSARAKVPFVDMVRPGFRGVGYEVAMATVEPLFRGLPLYVTDAVYSLDEIWAVNQRLVNGPAQAGLIVIDYLQLAEVRKARRMDAEDRYEVVSKVSREIKHMAQEFDVPIIGVSSITRSSAREGRRSELYDLRESGYLEYDAEAVIFLENPDWRPAMKDEDYEALNRRKVWDINVNLAAQRNGPTGYIPMKLLREYMEFMTPEEYEAFSRRGQEEPDFGSPPDYPRF